MKQEYFVVVLAHSLRGRLRRIHIPHQAVYAVLALALLGCFSAFGIVASYARMVWKVANYNALKHEADTLRTRYQNLQNVVTQTNQQLATLQLYAREVSLAYGIKQKQEGPTDIASEGRLVPTFAQSVRDYDFLKSGNALALRGKAWRLHAMNARPSIWPVGGKLMQSPYGNRLDPFSGEGAFHKGVDISASYGTAVRVTADGIVVFSQMESGYGRLVVVDHGANTSTYYAHLSKSYVYAGQEVRRGDILGLVGASGRATSPHLHYEVRLGGAPVNPYRYLSQAPVYQAPSTPKELF